MGRIDLKKQWKHLYSPSSQQVSVVDVPPLNFLMVDGAGDPNTSLAYREALEVLYALSYTLKFQVRKRLGLDYVVMPLEGLWWTDDPAAFSLEHREAWKWTAMIAQPEPVTQEWFEEARAEVRARTHLPALDRVRLERYHEGLSAQVLHLGPYAAEGPTIARLHGFIQEHGYELNGRHHEIYLSDPRKTAPERLRTILRQPIRRLM